MPITAIVSVSFQSSSAANNDVDKALCGSSSPKKMTGPFTKDGTATYRCCAASDLVARPALQSLFTALNKHAGILDSLSVSVIKHK